MKLSVMVYSFSNALRSGEMTVPDVVRFVRNELSIDALEVFDRHVTAVGLDAFRKLLDDEGMRTICYIGSGDFVQPTREAQQPAIDAVKAAIERSVALDCHLMLVTTGSCKPGLEGAEARRRIAEGLSECVEAAEAAGVTITIEPVGSIRAPHGTSSDLLEICELVGPGLRLTYDDGNFFPRGEDPVAALGKVWDKVAHVHLKDWRRLAPNEESPRVCEGVDNQRFVGEICGEGVLDYPAILAELKRRGYTGYMSFEYEGLGDPREAARRGIANIRALL